MEYKENGLPVKNFAISIVLRTDSEKVGAIFRKYYKDAGNVIGPNYNGYTGGSTHSFYYYITDKYKVDCGSSHSTEIEYTLEEFQDLLSGKKKDHITNTYPIF